MLKSEFNSNIYNPDLIGCGNSDKPRVAYYAEDWASQLSYFIENIISKPLIIIAQGPLLSIALLIKEKLSNKNLIKGFVFVGASPWSYITKNPNQTQQKILWNVIFNSFIGNLFFNYASSKKFIKSFSSKVLFAKEESIDNDWLDTLTNQAKKNRKDRFAAFSCLAGFWQKDYSQLIKKVSEPTLIVIGENAFNTSSRDQSETPENRLNIYLDNLNNAMGKIIPGRIVLPYESPHEFIAVLKDYIARYF